eukprot:5462070-Prymnesium_polylepis.2
MGHTESALPPVTPVSNVGSSEVHRSCGENLCQRTRQCETADASGRAPRLVCVQSMNGMVVCVERTSGKALLSRRSGARTVASAAMSERRNLAHEPLQNPRCLLDYTSPSRSPGGRDLSPSVLTRARTVVARRESRNAPGPSRHRSSDDTDSPVVNMARRVQHGPFHLDMGFPRQAIAPYQRQNPPPGKPICATTCKTSHL